MKTSVLIGGAALGALMSAQAMAGVIPPGEFTATVTAWTLNSLGSNAITSDTYYAGPIQFTVNGTTDTFNAYCIDFGHNVGIGTQVNFLEEDLTENGGPGPQSISEQNSTEAGWIASEYENGNGLESIAAQAAIWTLVGYGTQTFTGSNAVQLETDYTNILDAAAALPGPYHYADALIPVGYNPPWPGGSGFNPPQAMVVGVPESTTWAMMALGFAGLGFAGFRKARPKAAFA